MRGTVSKYQIALKRKQRQVVRRWRKRFLDGGIAAIKDRPRRGWPRRIPAKVWVKVALLVVQPPSDFGVAVVNAG